MTILYRAGRADRAAVSQVIQANLKDVGIDVKVTSMDNAALTKQWRTGQWEATVSGWTLPADPSFTNLYACKGGNNFTGYCDEELDKLMTSADEALDANVRKPLMFQAQAKLLDDMFSLPIFNNVAPVIYTDKADELQEQRHQPGADVEWVRVVAGSATCDAWAEPGRTEIGDSRGEAGSWP